MKQYLWLLKSHGECLRFHAQQHGFWPQLHRWPPPVAVASTPVTLGHTFGDAVAAAHGGLGPGVCDEDTCCPLPPARPSEWCAGRAQLSLMTDACSHNGTAYWRFGGACIRCAGKCAMTCAGIAQMRWATSPSEKLTGRVLFTLTNSSPIHGCGRIAAGEPRRHLKCRMIKPTLHRMKATHAGRKVRAVAKLDCSNLAWINQQYNCRLDDRLDCRVWNK